MLYRPPETSPEKPLDKPIASYIGQDLRGLPDDRPKIVDTSRPGNRDEEPTAGTPGWGGKKGDGEKPKTAEEFNRGYENIGK